MDAAAPGQYNYSLTGIASWEMNKNGASCEYDRRRFLSAAAAVPAGLAAFTMMPEPILAADEPINVLGPRRGYPPPIGTLVSMLTWMQAAIPRNVKGLSPAQLDYLPDVNANTIGALLLHLAATETYYQMNTFEGMKWGSWPDAVKRKWDAAMNLGKAGRESIKGHDLDYYMSVLKETREKSLAEFQRRDDAWLLTIDKQWSWGPTNNFCKWFHVCEHQSHHLGQIAFQKKRLPGSKQDGE